MKTENRIQELRKNLNLSQESLATILGTTQQAVSHMESDPHNIPINLLIKMSKIFNVTIDYILGCSDIKRDLNGQIRMNHEMDMYYTIILRFQHLTDINKKTLVALLERLEQAQNEQEKLVQKNLHCNENDGNANGSSMR